MKGQVKPQFMSAANRSVKCNHKIVTDNTKALVILHRCIIKGCGKTWQFERLENSPKRGTKITEQTKHIPMTPEELNAHRSKRMMGNRLAVRRLTKAKVRLALSMKGFLSSRDLSARLNVSAGTIQKIWLNKIWKEVERPTENRTQ